MNQHPAVKAQTRPAVESKVWPRRATVMGVMACLALAALGLYTAVGRARVPALDPPRHTGTAPPDPPSSSGMEREIERLHRRVNALTLQLANQGGSSQAPADGTGSPPAQQPESPPLTAEEERAQIRAAMERFQERFGREPLTSPWAATKQAELRARFQQSTLGRIMDLDCRGAMCRVEMEHASVEESMSFLDQNELQPGMRGTHYVRFPVGADGRRYTMFIEPADSGPHANRD